MKAMTIGVLNFLIVVQTGLSSFALAGKPKPYDENRVAWQDDGSRMLSGLRKADAFREKMLQGGNSNVVDARLMGRFLENFRIHHANPFPDRPDMEGFRVSAEQFVVQLRGEQSISAEDAFGPFSGRWYGVWDKKPVDHHWHPVQTITGKFAKANRDLPRLEQLQYAWIGDGFGWNFFIKPEGGQHPAILGYVYHLEAHQPGKIRNRFPLVGYADGRARLIWVTESSVYLEEVLEGKSRGDDIYVITGVGYEYRDGKLISDEQGFQSIYTRSPDNRPVFKRFPVELTVKSVKQD